ncbi:MAG TPA: ATP-binding cassette domain-containing protein [Nocardioides sp.]|nr:ATP-binding cassette domain-containing protein [Nocardioides sp.]
MLFQDGAMFGSMNLYDNVAFLSREHTKKSETEIRDVVMEKLDLVGLLGTEDKLPGEISGGVRKRAGIARALVLDPEILLFDKPDSGLDPVRTAFLNQLIVDLNAQIDATFMIVTQDINTARTVPDAIGLLYHKHLAKFDPREMLLSSEDRWFVSSSTSSGSARSGCRRRRTPTSLRPSPARSCRACRRSRCKSSPPAASRAAASVSRVVGVASTGSPDLRGPSAATPRRLRSRHLLTQDLVAPPLSSFDRVPWQAPSGHRPSRNWRKYDDRPVRTHPRHPSPRRR